MSGVDRLLGNARRGLWRPDARQTQALVDSGALLVDIRPAHQRAEFGEVPGAVIIERNNLEWRLDPFGTHRIAEAADADRVVVVMCQEGYASSLAAASLIALGRPNSCDLDGGYAAWKAAGLPTTGGTTG